MIPIYREYNYSDVYLVPKRCVVDSRTECNTSVKFGPRTFDMPVVAANMKSVVDEETCLYLAKNNWYYVMHRFEVDPVRFIEKMNNEELFSSISIGVNRDSYNEINEIIKAGLVPDYITLDIANAWSPKAERMIKHIKDTLPDAFLTAGNVATPDALADLEKWGADAVKVGIAGGAVCTTKNKTGFHRPMVSTTSTCVQVATKPVIADGGVVEHGDVAKAIACGATMVMAGALFAAYDESAGELIEIDGKPFKQYFGSASEHNKGKHVNVEGRKILKPYMGSMNKLLVELKEDLQSSISYAGGKDLSALLTCEFVAVH